MVVNYRKSIPTNLFLAQRPSRAALQAISTGISPEYQRRRNRNASDSDPRRDADRTSFIEQRQLTDTGAPTVAVLIEGS